MKFYKFPAFSSPGCLSFCLEEIYNLDSLLNEYCYNWRSKNIIRCGFKRTHLQWHLVKEQKSWWIHEEHEFPSFIKIILRVSHYNGTHGHELGQDISESKTV